MRDLEAGNFDISGLFPTNLMEIVRADKDLNSIVHSLLTENKIFSIPQKSTGSSEWNGDPDEGSLTEEAKLAEPSSNMDISKMAVEGSNRLEESGRQ